MPVDRVEEGPVHPRQVVLEHMVEVPHRLVKMDGAGEAERAPAHASSGMRTPAPDLNSRS